MDISVYIGELLYHHDCVIIPGFGGFVCNYKAAEIHPVLNTIAPPSKAISFNKNLRSNDGLLVSHIARSCGIAFDAANALVTGWVQAASGLLDNLDEIRLRGIGTLSNDIENNLQFTPENAVNYLKSSYGLKTVTAVPVLRGKEVEMYETGNEEKAVAPRRKTWKIAAAIVILLGMAGIAELMYTGTEIKPLRLNEAGVAGFMNHIFKVPEHEVQPLPVKIETPAPAASNTPTTDSSTLNTPPAPATDVATTPEKVMQQAANTIADGKGYYIIVGAFKEEQYLEATRRKLLQKYPAESILVESNGRLTKIGYKAGSNEADAYEALKAAKEENPSFWLLKK